MSHISLHRQSFAFVLRRVLLLFTAVMLISSTLPPSVARAATTRLVSKSGIDSGDCSATACLTIAYAIGQATAGDVIDIGAGTYPENLSISKNLTLTNEHRNAIVDGRGAGRVLVISSETSVGIINLTFQNGSVNGQGGGIWNAGNLSLHGVKVADNTATEGGGGLFNSGTLRIYSSTIDRNTAQNSAGRSYGGGIYNSSMLAIFESVISNNKTDSPTDSLGGGIYSCATLAITNTAVSTNIASGPGGGGGLYDCGHSDIASSTFSANTADSGSGGIANAGVMMLTNSTISGNHTNGSSGSGTGGGIGNTSGDLTILTSTITQNTALTGGGIAYTDRSLTLANTIVAGNSASTGPDCTGRLMSLGYNFIGNISDCDVTSAAGDQRGSNATPIDPHLGPLQDNGGFSFTHRPLPGSRVIDAGNPDAPGSAAGTCATTDQRGAHRPQGLHCDIGAYESGVITWYVSPAPLGSNANSCQSAADPCETFGTAILRATNGETIIVAAGVYTEGLPINAKSLTIRGAGLDSTIIDGGHGGRNVVTLAGSTSILSGMTFRNGFNSTTGGGGIWNSGTLTLRDSLVSTAATSGPGVNGAGIYNTGTLTVTHSTIRGNTADGRGGGIWNEGALTLVDSQVISNTAAEVGGGIYNAATLQLTNTLVADNLVDSTNGPANGGGIANIGQATIQASQVLRNRAVRENTLGDAQANGGGILHQGGVLTITDSIISGNVLEDRQAHREVGGGIFSDDNLKLTIRNSEISNHTEGGGLYIDQSGQAILDNLTIHDNQSRMSGGGIFVGANATVQITSGSILSNISGMQGGGVGIANNAIATLTNVTISDNQSATDAGGIYIGDSTIPTATVAINRAVIQNNHAGGYGGGIESRGNLTISDGQIISNTTPSAGGGIDNIGALTVTNSLISANRLENPTGDGIWGGGREWGGGIWSREGSTLVISGTTISRHRVGGDPGHSDGGGLYFAGVRAILTSVVITDNEVLGNGGGISAGGNTSLTITGSTISGNRARRAACPSNECNLGGGILFDGGTLTITNSTISGNHSDNLSGGIFSHGVNDDVLLDHVTITDNTAVDAGGVARITTTSKVQVRGSIIAGNHSQVDSSRSDCAGGLISEGGNLFGIAGQCNATSEDLAGTEADPLDPRLGLLADNGGPTPTHALQPNSPAIDKVPPGTCPATDQRGVSRPQPQGGKCDIGAYEASYKITDSGLDLTKDVWSFGNPRGQLDAYGTDFFAVFGEPTITRLETITNTGTITAASQLNLPFSLRAEAIRAVLPLSITVPITGSALPNLNAQMYYTTVVSATYADANVQWAGSALQAGLCVGMTSTTADFKAGGLDLTKFGTSSVISLTLTEDVRSLLQQYHMRQLSAEAINYDATDGRHEDARQYFSELEARIGAPTGQILGQVVTDVPTGWWGNPEIIGLANREGEPDQRCADTQVGHALLPRQLVRDDAAGIYRIYVSDPNYPPDGSGDAEDRYIEISQDRDGIWRWHYQIELPTPGHADLMWHGRALYNLPLDVLRHRGGGKLTLPTEDGQGVLLVNGGQKGAWGGQKGAWGGQKGAWGELGDGSRTGCVPTQDGTDFFFTREITGSFHLFGLTGPALYIPTSEINRTGSLTFNSHGGDVSDMLLFGEHTVIGYLGTANAQTQDRLTVDPSLQTVALHTSDPRSGKHITIYQMHEGEPGPDGISETRVVAVSNTDLGASEALTMTVVKDAHENVTSFILINHSDMTKQADIGFASVGGEGVSTVVFLQQEIKPGERREYIPEDWQNLETEPVIVKIDNNNDGHYDDQKVLHPHPTPSSRVLDSFNRRDGQIGSNWSGHTDSGDYRVAQRQASVRDGGAIYWRGQDFGATQEAFMTLNQIASDTSRASLLLKVQGATPDIDDGAIEVRYYPQTHQARILARLPGQSRRVIATFPVAFRAGDRFGARALDDGTVQVYRNDILIGQANAGDFFAKRGGHIGLRFLDANGAIFDDFGGGAPNP